MLSLDFELFWGVRGVESVARYGRNVAGVHRLFPRLLDLLAAWKVKATFATVGFLFFESKAELLANLPALVPTYTDSRYSPYMGYFSQVGADRHSDPLHFGHHLLTQIRDRPEHEIAIHTFSHYYCLERGQTAAQFEADVAASKAAAARLGVTLRSMVFPQNQINPAYLSILRGHGFLCYRGCERSWPYQPTRSLLRRGVRLLDSYLNLTGDHCYTLAELACSGPPYDVPASRFLRPYYPPLRRLEPLRLARIQNAMTHAARQGRLFHLWFHPHNMGINQAENLAFLEQIFDHYQKLSREYAFESVTMNQAAEILARQA